MDLTDTRYEVDHGLAWITIDRPDRMNAFRARTVDELIHLFTRAWSSADVGVICLTGAGERAFCAGGDQKQRAETGDYGPSESGRFEIDRLHRLIRDVPKPVIAAVNGVAIGGGHVLHVLCDVSIAADTATFGQVGPRVGSFDGGYGSAYLARVVGEKRAREIWFRCRRYDAATAERWGLVNQVVPAARLREEVREWADDMLALSPTALRFLKQSFNADTEHIRRDRPALVQRPRAVQRDRRGARGGAGVRREPSARVRALPRLISVWRGPRRRQRRFLA